MKLEEIKMLEMESGILQTREPKKNTELSNANGLLTQLRQLRSPHFDERPKGVELSLLVIHCISLPPGCFSGEAISDLFMGTLDCQAHPYFEQLKGLRVSAHVLIRRDGEVIQYVPFDKRAWHAGVSSYEGREACNDFSIGIELEGCDDQSFTDMQYQNLAIVSQELMSNYPLITIDRIVGHSDIAPGRKTDPGTGFDWAKYRELINT